MNRNLAWQALRDAGQTVGYARQLTLLHGREDDVRQLINEALNELTEAKNYMAENGESTDANT